MIISSQAVLAEALGLEQYMLYAHGSDLCHDAEMRHAMANCFEALMGALYLDSGINEADGVFSKALFGTDQVGKILLLRTCPKGKSRRAQLFDCFVRF